MLAHYQSVSIRVCNPLSIVRYLLSIFH